MQRKDYLTALIDDTCNHIAASFKCAYLAKIVKMTKPTASVQPLAMLNNQKQPMVENVHFITLPFKLKGNQGRPIANKLNYKVGDNVLVVVLDHDDEFFKNKGKFRVTSKRKHAIDYSVIVGKIASSSDFK